MRGLLVVNPKSTTTTPRAREVLLEALAHVLDLQTVTTDHRGHASELGAQAVRDGMDFVIAYGGDGTVNEVINGLRNALTPGAHPPAVGVIPGGSANVFVRSLGYSNDPVEATGELIAAIREGKQRTISLGIANGRWFCCNAGLGIDAQIVAIIDAARAEGKAATPTRYVTAAVNTFFRGTDRKMASMVVVPPDQPPVRRVFLAVVQNGSPWTYLGPKAVNPSPEASYDKGLDLWAVRNLSVTNGVKVVRRILAQKPSANDDNIFTLHDADRFVITCLRPTSFQIDGEAIGDVDEVVFESVPNALTVIG